jgi:DNA (cytosine-5)-methyltransferase 1
MSGLRYGSVCSGIEAASVAWKPLGWRASFVSEIEPFPRAVLSHHQPETPLHGDFTTIQAGQYEPIDLLVGGTPCQSFSIAGLRGGLDDDRGNLALEYLRLADRLRPRWLVWENVPGVLSSNGGRDFGAILGGMVELGYGVAYRVLDAQHFGVAQRRRRVFVVGYLGDWRRAAAVLFERESLSGHPAPRREAGPSVAALTACGVGTCGADDNQGQAGHLIAHSLRGEGFDASEDGTGRGTPLVPICFSSKDHGADALDDLSPTLRAGGHDGSHANAGVPPAIAFDTTQVTSKANRSNPKPGDPCHPLAAGAHAPAIAFSIMPMNSGKDFKGRETDIAQPVMAAGPAAGNQGGDYVVQSAIPLQEVGKRTGVSTTDVRAGLGIGEDGDPMFTMQAGAQHGVGFGSAVRRLTPRECERLQGFPDDYTLIPVRGKPAADGPRYKSLGNSMAVPVMAWIGRRIQMIEETTA